MDEFNSLPKCFFNPADFTEALLYIRRCLLGGGNGKDMICELLEHYKTCSDSAQKKTLIKLMTAIDEFYSHGDSRQKALEFKLLDPENSPKDRSCGYTWFKENALKDGYLLWLDDYRQEHISSIELEHSFDDPRYWMVVPPKERENVITVCKEADVYCVVEKDLSINFVVMENNSGAFEVDEYGDAWNPPTYFSASQKETDSCDNCDNYENCENCDCYDNSNTPGFISPVYRAKVAKSILEYCLAKVGFSYVPINIKVVFTSPWIELVNIDNYIPGKHPELFSSRKWIGVDITFAKDIKPKQGFMLHCPQKDLVSRAKDIYDQMMLSTLTTSLYVTSKIYKYMYQFPEGEFMHSKPCNIEEYAEDLDIFLNNK